MAGQLYVVATPIGNLGDITLRALETLRAADAVAAEDTRVTARLLAHFGIAVRTIALHEHNERRAAAEIVKLVAAGKSVALVSDAGTPGLSDPGAHAVAAVREAGLPVVAVPGPSAAACALSVAGRPLDHVLFYGFLPATPAARRRALEALAGQPHALLFYEAPHRIRAALGDMAAVLGAGRAVTLARELTKLHEEVHTCALGEAQAWVDASAHRERGEYVVIVDPAPAGAGPSPGEAQRVLKLLLAELPAGRAAALAARITGAPRDGLYAAALALKGEA